MRIGELARRSGLSASHIRLYEAKRLLTAVSRKFLVGTPSGTRAHASLALPTTSPLCSRDHPSSRDLLVSCTKPSAIKAASASTR
jgi:hypothetical protein